MEWRLWKPLVRYVVTSKSRGEDMNIGPICCAYCGKCGSLLPIAKFTGGVRMDIEYWLCPRCGNRTYHYSSSLDTLCVLNLIVEGVLSATQELHERINNLGEKP